MPGKRMRLALTLLASLGIPYLWFNDGWSEWLGTDPAAARHTGSTHLAATPVALPPVDPTVPASPTPVGSTVPPAAAATPQTASAANSTAANSLAEVLRFDVSPGWVMQRWPRVTTVSQHGLAGLRVPLVTGTQLDDLAGSLTYYFDKTDRVQRIAFQGLTGDDRKLVAIVTAAFGMQPEPTLGGGTYVARWNANPMSALRVSYAPVVRHDRPHSRLEVILEINRPDVLYGLSPEFEQLLVHDRGTNRW